MKLRWHAVLAALCLTLLNAIKPLHIDDTFILEVARQIAAHPFDPYGFDIFWLQWPQPVSEELTPPVVPYWWSLGLAWLPAAGFAWKLWFLPFALVLAWGFSGLLRRLAPGIEKPCLWGALLSPAVLPGFNLMQDIPAMSLGIAGLSIYLRAAQLNSLAWAAGAGLVAGLATQTKYTTVSMLGAMLAYGWLHRRKQTAVLTAAIAVLVFFGWEWAMTLRYGQGMFLGQVQHGLFWFRRTAMIAPLIQIVGGLAAFCIPLLLLALGTTRRIAAAAGILILGWLTLVQAAFPDLSPYGLGALGALALSLAVALVASRLHDAGPTSAPPAIWLSAWLSIEIGIYFASSPFPAARRAVGVCLVLFVISAWGVAPRKLRLRPVGAIVLGCAIGYALLVQAVDVLEARAQRDAAVWAASLDEGRAESTTWFLGHWGFQYYAERHGMRPLVPDESRMRAGDRLAIPSVVDRPDIALREGEAEEIYRRRWDDGVPWSTVPGYYSGATPFVGARGPRLEVRVYGILADTVAPTGWTPKRLADWAKLAGGRTAAAAAPALLRILRSGDAESRRIAMRGLVELELDPREYRDPLLELIRDPDPAIRLGSVIALSRFADAAAAAAVRAAMEDPDPEVAAAARWAGGAAQEDSR